jgi:hypothetical protein
MAQVMGRLLDLQEFKDTVERVAAAADRLRRDAALPQ